MLVKCQTSCDLGGLSAFGWNGVQISHHVKNNGLAVRADVYGSPSSLIGIEVHHPAGFQRQVFVAGEGSVFLGMKHLGDEHGGHQC